MSFSTPYLHLLHNRNYSPPFSLLEGKRNNTKCVRKNRISKKKIREADRQIVVTNRLHQ